MKFWAHPVTRLSELTGQVGVCVSVRFMGEVSCPSYGGARLRPKDRRLKRVPVTGVVSTATIATMGASTIF
jgi:hypothetical protein